MSEAGARLRVLLATSHYPSRHAPNDGTFVHALAEAWVRAEHDVVAVAPRPYWKPRSEPLGATPVSGARKPLHVLRPGFLSASNVRLFGTYSTLGWTAAQFGRAVLRAARGAPFEPDVAYAHFLFPAGAAALRVARARGIPAVVALGESDFGYYEARMASRRIAETLHAFDGILSVSRENRDHCVTAHGVDAARIEVVPNAVETTRFRPRDRHAVRQKLGLPADRPIVAFTGWFIERKGPLRVLEALRSLPEVGAVFLGSGPQTPSGEQVLFAGRVPNEAVPEWLCAADCFVLPTQSEGSPNAILEAMACGLPVVSSDIPSIREAVDERSALLVPPKDTEALAAALRRITADPALRRSMAAAARALGARSSLEQRADRIAGWLAGIVRDHRRAAL